MSGEKMAILSIYNSNIAGEKWRNVYENSKSHRDYTGRQPPLGP